MTTSLRRPAGSASLLVCFVLTLAGCSGASGPAPAPAAAPAKKLGAITLGEKPAFPLKAHLESADIAAGKYKAAEFIDFGADLFHTPFNGLDGVGVAVGPGGIKVNRFAPIGPTGPVPLVGGARARQRVA